ncbi:MAG TPA: hypothetical protein VHD87_02960 [Acidimicrobiales bacterium]|nr:hypothetical protein [Acidimicrobiales bacterium]
MSICVVVSDDHGARQASHGLRAAGWGGVAFETNVDAARRTAESGRACVLNVSRLDPAVVAPLLAEPYVYDWRQPPPEMSQDEWLVLYGAGEFTERTRANRLKTATAKIGDDFPRWRLRGPGE